jgi:uncharacterized protein
LIGASASPPYSSCAPGILRGVAGEGLCYAFNCDQPRGIKLLSPGLAITLDALLSTSSSAIPDLTLPRSPDEEALFKAGLIKHQGRYSQPLAAEPVAPGSFNVWLHTSEECNLGCYYCYIPELSKHRKSGHTPLSGLTRQQSAGRDLVDQLLGYCREHGYPELFIKFAGGEPTLDIRGIDILCRYVERVRGSIRVRFGMLSNGIFDPQEVLPVLHRNQISLSISVDGLAESHDRIRFQRTSGARIGSWDKVLHSAEALRAAGLRTYFLFTLTRKNMGDLGPFSELVLSTFGGGFRISPERGRQAIPDEVQSYTSSVLRRLYMSLSQTAPIDARLHRDAKFAEWTLDKKKTAACSSCRDYIAIGMDGAVTSCQMTLKEPVSNLNDESISTAMTRFSQHVETNYLTDPASKSGGCTRCEFRHTCAGGCPQHTRNVFRTINHPSPWCRLYGEFFPTYVEANAVHMARRYRFLQQSEPKRLRPAGSRVEDGLSTNGSEILNASEASS